MSGTTTIVIDPREKERRPGVIAVKFFLGGSPGTFDDEADLGGDGSLATVGNGTRGHNCYSCGIQGNGHPHC